MVVLPICRGDLTALVRGQRHLRRISPMNRPSSAGAMSQLVHIDKWALSVDIGDLLLPS